MDLMVEDTRIKNRQRIESRNRKRLIKKFLKEQEKRCVMGGHDRSGTRVRESMMLKQPVLQKETFVIGEQARLLKKRQMEDLVDEDLKRHQAHKEDPSLNATQSSAGSSPIIDTNISPLELPLHPSQSLPPTSHRTRKIKKCNILKNPSQTIGSGSFGVVYMGLNRLNGELVAVKEIELKPGDGSEKVCMLTKEISLMKRLVHNNIVRYYGAERTPTGIQIFMEYVPGGSLKRIVSHFGKLQENVVKMYIRQMFLGLGYLHANQVAHLDLKSDNALLGVTGEVKLADFGASERLETLSTKTTGTPSFMAPEVIKGTGHTLSADIWSMGITTIELLDGAPPDYGMTDSASIMYKIASSNTPPSIPAEISHECNDLIAKCLQRHPADRPTVSEILMHSFMQGYEDEEEEKSVEEKPVNTCPSTVLVSFAAKREKAIEKEEEGEGEREVKEKGKEKDPGNSAKAVDKFVCSAGMKLVTNSVADLSYLRSLTHQKRKGVLSEFELTAKKSKLFGMVVKTPLVECGMEVEDVA